MRSFERFGAPSGNIEQLGQLVAATGADALDAETLAGVLPDAIGSKI